MRRARARVRAAAHHALSLSLSLSSHFLRKVSMCRQRRIREFTVQRYIMRIIIIIRNDNCERGDGSIIVIPARRGRGVKIYLRKIIARRRHFFDVPLRVNRYKHNAHRRRDEFRQRMSLTKYITTIGDKNRYNIAYAFRRRTHAIAFNFRYVQKGPKKNTRFTRRTPLLNPI